MSVPDQFLDFLTGLRIRDPVRAADGHLYDRATISEWFETLEAAGRPIVSPRPPSHAMARTLIVDAVASGELNQLLEDLALNDPGAFIKTLAVLRALFDVLDPLGDFLNSVLEGFKVRLATQTAPGAPPRSTNP